MTVHVVRLITACIFIVGLTSTTLMAQTSLVAGGSVPPVPTKIEVPAGHVLFFTAHAVGTQNYVCLPTPGGAAWTFVAPQATLFLTFNDQILQQVTTHFLSPNPDTSEQGRPRPTWQHSFDSSRVWAKSVASSDDPSFVEQGAIPWLLLERVGSALGPLGGSFLTQTAYIQRLNTSGGIAPSTGCMAATIGAIALSPYTADYFFYKARTPK
jgi:uncharacterized protein DUF3455